MQRHVCAVDVGTGSARAGIIDGQGRLLGRGEHPILMNRPQPGHAEHDSEDIWRAVCAAVRLALQKSGVPAQSVAGIGFDATCSTVIRDAAGGQLGLSPYAGGAWDTIVWLDHRAIAEADECTAGGHAVLEFVGGAMSPEMAVPKLMWLKRRRPDIWARAGHLFDLADFLTWRACGSLARSQCTMTCKWTYLSHEEDGWHTDFLASAGLPDLLERGRLPARATPVGADLGPLTAQAARDLGLTTACRVAAGVIDAYAGALGVLGGFATEPSALDRHLALIAGTSSCVMMLSRDRKTFPGGWGPYWGAALPGFWVSEGGQSATGALLDHVIRLHGAGGKPDAALHAAIAGRIGALRAAEGEAFAARLHVLPDFHGNRSPLADPHALGVISGLALDASFDGLCRLYWRTCVAIALGVRHILDTLHAGGIRVDTLHVTGGHTKNPLLMELYADAVGCAVTEPCPEDDAVLLGTGMLAAAAAGLHPDLAAVCAAMHRPGRACVPRASARAGYARDYRIFLEMHRQRQALDRMA
jgi:FGGY-family pentulose kinase